MVTDQIRRAAEVVLDDLPEQHLSSRARFATRNAPADADGRGIDDVADKRAHVAVSAPDRQLPARARAALDQVLDPLELAVGVQLTRVRPQPFDKPSREIDRGNP